SVASASVRYLSVTNPTKADPEDFSTVRSTTPETTNSSSPSRCTTVRRTSLPPRTNEWSCGPSSVTMRSQLRWSTCQRPPVTHAQVDVKWSESRIANSSGVETPSRASEKIVFFWLSVATQCALSPCVCTRAKSPRSCEETVKSVISWTSPSRRTCTRWFSALPYWLKPSSATSLAIS